MRILCVPSPDDIVRFLNKVEKPSESGCWLWSGCKDKDGYGQFKWKGRAWWAHRISYLFFRGELPDYIEVHHECTNPKCVCPWHLETKTKSENTAEGNRRRKKGYAVGSRIATLSPDQEDPF